MAKNRNDMNENWIKWEPAEGLAKKYSINSISDTLDKFEIILSEYDNINHKIKVKMKFDFVDSYRCTDKSLRLKDMGELVEKRDEKFHNNWTFFKVLNSKYLKYLSKQSYGIIDDRNLMHFALITEDLIIDLINPSEPIVEFIEKD
jgi:hypothetical protein